MSRIRQAVGYIFALMVMAIVFFAVTPLFFRVYFAHNLATHPAIQLKWWNTAVAIYILLLFLWSRGWRRFCPNLLLATIGLAWNVFANLAVFPTLDITLRLHFIGFSLLALVVLKRFRDHKLNAILFLYSCVIGNELFQYYLPARKCELEDMLTNCVAVTFGIAWWMINRKKSD